MHFSAGSQSPRSEPGQRACDGSEALQGGNRQPATAEGRRARAAPPHYFFMPMRLPAGGADDKR